MEKFISKNDSILNGITFDDLITAVQCNEKEINPETVTKVFIDILNTQLIDAKNLLNEKMSFILKEAK